MAEVFLRQHDYGGYPPIFREIGPVEGRQLVELDWRGPESYFFEGRFGRGSSYQQSFCMPKAPHTVRILLAGESAIKGDPQPLPFSSGAFLERMLEGLWPGRDVEIINLGVTAVASFPVWDITRQALHYDPDLLVIYTGNNEFYGAYGVASQHFAGTHPAALRATRALHSLAFVQWILRRVVAQPSGEPATLMDAMMHRQEIPPDSRLRQRAADNLGYHVQAMVAMAQALQVPALVCTLACNERDLAPMGSGREARDRYDAAQNALRAGRSGEASNHFQQAVDLDTRPWRPTSLQNDALLQAAQAPGAILCDVRAAFRAASPAGTVGWELMDDHVHPSLAGQYLLARTIIQALTNAPERLRVDPQAVAALPSADACGSALGTNVYDAIGVGMGMMSLFRAPFLRKSNPDAFLRWERQTFTLGRSLPPDVAQVFDAALRAEAQRSAPRPMAGIAGLALAGLGRHAEAEPLLALACKALPPYSTLHRQFTFERYRCRQQAQGALRDADRAAIRAEIRAGEVLNTYGADASGMNRFYMDQLRALLGEQ